MNVRVIFWVLAFCSSYGCKRPNSDSNLSASNVGELKRTSGFFKSAWDLEFETNFAKLPTTGQASRIPYSGAWYPYYNNGLNSGQALLKYDQAFHGGTSRSYTWESKFHSGNQSDWFGHCNGFASAAMRHTEPKETVNINGVVFQPTDIKALLAEIYLAADFLFLGGDRCEVKAAQTPADADLSQNSCEDINPGTFHAILGNWIGLRKQTIIMDESYEVAVWNYPLYHYASGSRTVTEAEALQVIGSQKTTYEFNPEATQFAYVETVVTFANARDGQESLRFNDPLQKRYTYILELNAEGDIIGGEWSAQSRTEHPDFAWVALEPRQGNGLYNSGNPFVDVDEVLELWAKSVGYDSYEDAPPAFSFNDQFKNWGKSTNYTMRLNGHHHGTSFFGESSVFSIDLDEQFEPEAPTNGGLNIFAGQTFLASPTIVPGDTMTVFSNSKVGVNTLTLQWLLPKLETVERTMYMTFP